MDVKAMSPTSVLCFTNDWKTYLVDIKHKKMTTPAHKALIYNHGVWAGLAGDSIIFSDGLSTKGIPLASLYKRYGKLDSLSLSWVARKGKYIYICCRFKKNIGIIRTLLQIKNGEIVAESEAPKFDPASTLTPFCNVKVSPSGRMAGMIIYSTERRTSDLFYFVLEEGKGQGRAENVKNFEWVNDTEMVLMNDKVDKFELYNLRNTNRSTILADKHIADPVFRFYNDKIIYYNVNRGFEYFEFLFRTRFITFDVTSKKKQIVIEFTKNRLDYYQSLKWDTW